MVFSNKKEVIQWVLVILSCIMVAFIVFHAYMFFQHLKKEQRAKIELWARAYTEFNRASLEEDVSIYLSIMAHNQSIPLLVSNNKQVLSYRNITIAKKQDTISFLKEKKKQFEKQNIPLILSYQGEDLIKIYYGNSKMLQQLKYYPLALLLILFLFGVLVFVWYRTSKISEQNKLWAGMAKETAHQIGTPLSSLLGWNEILKTEQIDQDVVTEIEKDIHRLQTITDRFSKIGSAPVLEVLNVVSETQKTYQYLQTRSSKYVQFSIALPKTSLYAAINPQLFTWTIENLVKNAIDAMRGKGSLHIAVFEKDDFIKIQVMDTGKGIPKAAHKKIFEPGYTTKKRGWGLGLSLVKRIVVDYHSGRVRVLRSSKDRGTVMQISLKKVYK